MKVTCRGISVHVRPVPCCASVLAGVYLGTGGPPLKIEAESETIMVETES